MQKFSSSYVLVLIKSILRLFGLGCGITIAVIFIIPTAFFMFGIYLIDAYSNWLNFDSVDTGMSHLFKSKAVTKVEENPLPEIKEPLLSSDFTKFDKTFNPEQLTWVKFNETQTAQQLADHMKMWQGLKGKMGFHENKDNKPFDHQKTLQSKGQTNRNLISHNTFSPPALSTSEYSSELQVAFHAMPESYQSINRLVIKICGVEIIVCFVDPLEGVGYSQHRWIGCASYAVGRIYFLKFPTYNTIMHELIHMYCYLTGQNDRSSFNAHEDMVEFMGCAFFLLREACESINTYCVDNVNILTKDNDNSSYSVQRTGPVYMRTKYNSGFMHSSFSDSEVMSSTKASPELAKLLDKIVEQNTLIATFVPDYMEIPADLSVPGLPETFESDSGATYYTYESLVSLHADDSFHMTLAGAFVYHGSSYTRQNLLDIMNHSDICIVRHNLREPRFVSIVRNALRDKKKVFVCVDGLGIIDCAKFLIRQQQHTLFQGWKYWDVNIVHNSSTDYEYYTSYFDAGVDPAMTSLIGEIIDLLTIEGREN